jgi:carbon storage regulator CsrA
VLLMVGESAQRRAAAYSYVARNAVWKGYPRMLVLSRRLNEKIVFPGTHTTVQVLELQRGVVRLGIDAPPNVTVLREELYNQATEWQTGQEAPDPRAAQARLAELTCLVGKRLAILTQGAALLRRQLPAGLGPDAAMTLDEIEDELYRLRNRLGAEAARPLLAPAPSPRPVPRALLVEDNPVEREAMALFLRKAGVEVEVAGDGIDALDHLRRRRPDVVLLDMGLPRCDGPTTVRVVRHDPAYAGLKIFAVSGHSAEEFDIGKGPTGVDRWFQKPIDPGVLVREVTRELDPSLSACSN